MADGFTTTGFAPFPDCYHDNLHVGEFSMLSDKGLDHMTNEYGGFVQRTDLMPRAREAGARILEHLIFELAYRDGVYDATLNKLEDETSDCA